MCINLSFQCQKVVIYLWSQALFKNSVCCRIDIALSISRHISRNILIYYIERQNDRRHANMPNMDQDMHNTLQCTLLTAPANRFDAKCDTACTISLVSQILAISNIRIPSKYIQSLEPKFKPAEKNVSRSRSKQAKWGLLNEEKIISPQLIRLKLLNYLMYGTHYKHKYSFGWKNFQTSKCKST